MPPAPANHFNDFAGVTRPETARRLNAELAQFERESSNQLVVAIYPRLPSNSSVEDFSVRVAEHWGVGQKDRKNGAVLFLFQASRDIRIVTGYGLEGVLPDARCKQIIENEIAPRFRQGDFDGGLTAGVRAMIAAVRGEYVGPGRTVAEGRKSEPRYGRLLGIFLVFIVVSALFRTGFQRRSVVYQRSGRRSQWDHRGPPWGGGSGGFGGLGGGSSGGGGSFSGGGGRFGGGGAGGKW